MICETAVVRLCLLVQDQVNQVKSGEERGWQLDVLDDGEFGVILGMDRVSSGQDRGSGVQGANDTGFGNGDGLLLHGFVKNHTSVIIHFIELINAADTAIGKHQSTTFKYKLTRLRVPRDVDGETDS